MSNATNEEEFDVLDRQMDRSLNILRRNRLELDRLRFLMPVNPEEVELLAMVACESDDVGRETAYLVARFHRRDRMQAAEDAAAEEVILPCAVLQFRERTTPKRRRKRASGAAVVVSGAAS